jgi:hypothetical protein
MDQNRGNEKSCSVCNRRFDSDRELQEHQRTAHSQDKNRPSSEQVGDRQGQGKKRERIA